MARASAPLLDNFWLLMAGQFGHSWTSQYGAAPDGIGADVWSRSLAGMTGQQVAAGLRATLLLGSDWPPSAGRFRALCLGIPEFAAVRLDLRNAHAARKPFTILTWNFLDAQRYRNANQDKADKLLREAYDEAKAHVMLGGALPQPAVAEIPHTPRPFVPASPETVARAMAEMAELVGMAPKDAGEVLEA